MLLPRLQPPLRAALTSIGRTGGIQQDVFSCINQSASKSSPILMFVRHASHAQQGAVNKAKDGPRKRLGAKKSGEQYVIPGNIIFRQRGTHWFPGDNCAMGRDHTIYATEPGFVKYYKDPDKHPKRQYIGVVFKRDDVLPLPRNSVRRRRLGMELLPISSTTSEQEVDVELAIEKGEGADIPVLKQKEGGEKKELQIRPGYMYREANWEIGRAAEKAGIKVKEFVPGDRWTAWRKSAGRRKKNAEKRGLGRGKR